MKTTLTLMMPVEVELHLDLETDPVRINIADAEFVQFSTPHTESEKQTVLDAMGEEKYMELLRELISRSDCGQVHIKFPEAMTNGGQLLCGRPVDEDTLASADILWLFTFLVGHGLCTTCERLARENIKKFNERPTGA